MITRRQQLVMEAQRRRHDRAESRAVKQANHKRAQALLDQRRANERRHRALDRANRLKRGWRV